MRLRDRYDGSNDPFEGDRTVVWRSLPANAVVTKATLTLEPARAPGASDFTETLGFGPQGPAFGATVQQVDATTVEVNFHARRTATGIVGLPIVAPQTLGIDVGGGVFLAVAANGTVPALQGPGYDLSRQTLPGLTAQRLRLASATLPGDLAALSVGISTMPSNVTLRFGKSPPFWSRNGELGVAVTTPDITTALQRALADAAVTSGYVVIPLVVHSDTLGRVALTLDVEYLGAAPLLAPGLREVVLPYDYASVSTTDPTALQAILPAGAAVVSPQTGLQIRGAFDASRVIYGLTGPTAESTTVHCSVTETIAQPVIPATNVNVSSFDVFVAADGPAARLAIDLHDDFDGKPAQTSLLARAVPFDLTGDASQQRHWTNVKLTAPAQLKAGTRYWAIVEALDGKAFLGVDTAPAPDRMMQRSTDSGFSWRAAGLPAPLLLRLRTVPDRFQMPIDFVAGTGAQAQRVSLRAYDALGKIDTVIDRPEIAGAIQSYVYQAAAPPCAAAELLQNPNFTQWAAQGTALRALATLTVGSGGSLSLLDTFFETPVANSSQLQALATVAFSPDGATLYAASSGVITAIDAASFVPGAPLAEISAQALAVDPQGRVLYAASDGNLVAIDLTTGETPSLAFLDGAGALSVSPDGTTIYAAGGTEVLGFDLVRGNELYRVSVTSSQPALAISPDGATLVTMDQTRGVVLALNAATGSPRWAASLSQSAATPIVPWGVAVAADGVSVYAVGSTQAGATTVGGGPAGGPTLTLYAFDGSGRFRAPSIPLGIPAGAASLAVKPQGDRLYIGPTPMALDPGGGRLAVSGNNTTIAPIAVGNRRPVFWTLTAGDIAPDQSSDAPTRLEASLDNGSISQVVAVAPGCAHDFTVVAEVGSDREKRFASPDAVAELFWLDASGALLRGDQMTLPASNNPVTQQSRFLPPAGSAQAEVRFRVAGGLCTLQTVSLKTNDSLVEADAWQPDPATSSRLAITRAATGTLYRNIGTGDGAVRQTVALTPAGPYALDFAGRVIAGSGGAPSPSIVVSFADTTGGALGAAQTVSLDAVAFGAQPAQLTAPPSSTSATIRIVLPAGTGLVVERMALVSVPMATVPVSFIAQSPGQLHVSNARIVYDQQAAPVPQAPPGGLSRPTPPDATPGAQGTDCGCDEDGASGTAALPGAPGPVLPPPAPSATSASGSFALQRAEPTLDAVKGIGPARKRRLAAAGIVSVRDLAAATPEAVAKILSGPASTVELGRTLIQAARTALAAQTNGGQE